MRWGIFERHFLRGDGDELTSKQYCFIRCGLRSRRLEVVGAREKGRARGRQARGEGDIRAPSPLACLHLARPFILAPTTSKRLLCRLHLIRQYCLLVNSSLSKRKKWRLFKNAPSHGHSRWSIPLSPWLTIQKRWKLEERHIYHQILHAAFTHTSFLWHDYDISKVKIPANYRSISNIIFMKVLQLTCIDHIDQKIDIK